MPDSAEVFDALKRILQPYADRLVCTADSDTGLSLDTRHIMKNGQRLFFAAVQIKKNYVSFYLMPVYVNPELLAGITPELKKRMQGKSCFNFKTVDPVLLDELAALTASGFEDYRKKGYVNS